MSTGFCLIAISLVIFFGRSFSANILWWGCLFNFLGNHFSSEIFWYGFFFQHFVVGISLPKTCGRECIFQKNMVENVSPESFFGKDIGSKVWILLQTLRGIRMVLQKNCGRKMYLRKETVDNTQQCHFQLSFVPPPVPPSSTPLLCHVAR